MKSTLKTDLTVEALCEGIVYSELLALKWVSRHRHENCTDELLTHFETVIKWTESVFTEYREARCGLEWGTLYEKYHHTPYDSREVEEKVKALDEDLCVEKKSGMFEYVLDGAQDPSLLQVRVFSKAIKKAVYARQTKASEAEGKSNCPLCVLGTEASRTTSWKFEEMDTDHVTAWSKGGGTSHENCQVLCRPCSAAKGNK